MKANRETASATEPLHDGLPQAYWDSLEKNPALQQLWAEFIGAPDRITLLPDQQAPLRRAQTSRDPASLGVQPRASLFDPDILVEDNWQRVHNFDGISTSGIQLQALLQEDQQN